MPYTFTQEDFNKFSEDIIKAEGDQAILTTLLADMQGVVVDAIAKDIANTEKVTTVTAENERLRKANMDLFLRIGTPAQPEQQIQDEQPMDTKAYMQAYFDKLDGK